MPKINIGKSKNILLSFVLKIVFSIFISYVFFISLFTAIIYKADLDLNFCSYIGVGIDLICSYIIAKISIGSFKNNRTIMSLFSVFPVMVISVINYCAFPISLTLFIIRLAGIPSCAILASLSKKKLKV